MKKIELRNRKGQKVVGILTQPGNIRGTCIVQHGYSGMKEQPHIIAMQEVFLKHGFQTFNFDTTNSFGESEGTIEEASLGLHYEDFEDVANWAQKQDWYTGPFSVIGHSMGGYAVARYAEEYPELVDYCLPIAPVVSGKLSFEAKEESEPGLLATWKKEGMRIYTSRSTGKIKHSPWDQMEERLNHDLIPQAGELIMPVFLYVGSEDDSIPPKHVKILFDVIPDGNKSMVIADGAPHTYCTDEQIRHMSESIDSWLEEKLSK